MSVGQHQHLLSPPTCLLECQITGFGIHQSDSGNPHLSITGRRCRTKNITSSALKKLNPCVINILIVSIIAIVVIICKLQDHTQRIITNIVIIYSLQTDIFHWYLWWITMTSEKNFPWSKDWASGHILCILAHPTSLKKFWKTFLHCYYRLCKPCSASSF